MTITTGVYKPRRTSFVVGGLPIQVISADLAYVDLLMVKVDGISFNIIRPGSVGSGSLGFPSSREVLWQPAYGRMLFSTEMSSKAKVFVIYQH